MTIIETFIRFRNDLKIWVANNLRVKLDKNLGADNANKILSIDAEGNIVPIDNTSGGGGGEDFEQVQADWEENDATSNAYIKNRPFYVNDYIVPFATLQFQKSEYNNNYKSTNLVNLIAEEGIDGKEYIVEWDGVEYTTTCRTVKFNTPGTVLGESIGLEHFIGNSALLNSDIATSTEQDTGEPFALRLTKEQFDGWNSVFHMDLGCVVTKSLNSTHTIRISGGDNIVKLSEKYLPDGIATEDFVREQIAAIEIPEGGNSGPVHWNDITNKPFIVVEENKRIFVDHSKVDTNIAFTSAELNATFVRLTEETLSKDELIGATLTATFANGHKISGVVSESSIQFEDDNGLLLIVEDLPIAVFYKAGQYTINIDGVETTVQVPIAGIYTTDYAVIEVASSEITKTVTKEYLNNECLSILEISSKPTEFLHEIEFTSQWNTLFNVYAHGNLIDEETFNAWNANTKPVVVKYDNVEYICMPQLLSFGVDTGVAIGNLANFGGTGNNEPFAITCSYDSVSGLYFAMIGSTVDMGPTAHSVAIHLQDETYKIKDEYLEDFIRETNSKIKVYQVGSLSEITETPIQGDQAIVTNTIKDDLKSYTAYVWDEALNEGAGNWVAMDGNYNAENVYFGEDLITTVPVGNIALTNGQATIGATGKNLKQVFDMIYRQEKNPEITPPSISISAPNNKAYEVGSKVKPSYSGSCDPGSYEFGPETGVTASNWKATNNITTESISEREGEFNEYIVNDDSYYVITISASLSAGEVPNTNLGNPYEDGQISAQEKVEVESKAITGYRNTFYGTLTHQDELTSAIIRSLTPSNEALSNGSTFDIGIPQGCKRVAIAYPSDLRNMTSVIDVNDSNTNIVTAFLLPQLIQVEGAADGYDKEYKVYTLDFANPYNTNNTYKVTI